MKDIYFEPNRRKPKPTKKVLNIGTHWLTVISPYLSMKLASKLLGNPFSRRVYEMRTVVKPESVVIATSFGDICLHKFSPKTQHCEKHILLFHGWGDSSTRFTQLINQLLLSGFTLWSFDQVGHGKSSGNYSHLFAFIEGTRQVIEYLDRENCSPQAIVGHSMGALGVMNQPAELIGTKKVVLISAPALFFENMYHAVASVGVARIMLTNLLEQVSALMGTHWKTLAPRENTAIINNNFLFVHDTTDLTCSYKGIKNLLTNIEHEFYTTENLGHIKILKDPQMLSKVADFCLLEDLIMDR
jgi:pimeloyl-ACP methyl ester carboxylesterase